MGLARYTIIDPFFYERVAIVFVIRTRTLRRKVSLAILALISVAMAFSVYATYIDRTVYTTEQLVIIPDKVTSDSWVGLESVLVQDISEYSLYQDFSESNAAYISELGVFSKQTSQTDEDTNTATSSSPDSGGDTSSATSTGSEDSTQSPAAPSQEPAPTPTPESSSESEPAKSSVPEANQDTSFMWGVPVTTGKYLLAQAVIEESVNEAPVTITEPEVVDAPVPETNEPQASSIGTPDDDTPTTESGENTENATASSTVTSAEETTTDLINDGVSTETRAPTTGGQYSLLPCEEAAGCSTHSMIFTGFTLPEFESGAVLDSAQLRLSLGAKTKSVSEAMPQRYVIEYSYDTATDSAKVWTKASVIDIKDEISNSINGGYFLVSIDTPPQADQVANLQIKISYQGDVTKLDRAYVEGIWLEVTAGKFYESGEEAAYTDTITYGRDLQAPLYSTLDNGLTDTSLGTLPKFNLSYDPQQNFFGRLFKRIFTENTLLVDKISVFDNEGTRIDVPVSVTYHDDTSWTLSIDKQPQGLRPGKYRIEATMVENDTPYVDSFEFYWGVLAVNTKKSMYAPNEPVTLNLAALTDKGDTICDANLELKIIDPKNNIYEVPVEQSGSCAHNNVTDVPDYFAQFTQTGEWGVYTIQLQHKNKAGEVVHKIIDSFEVRDYIPFDIERTAPTRIYPPSPYAVSLNIKANRDFVGDINERVPRGFILSDIDGANISTLPDYTLITWKDITMKEGETLKLSYTFDAPDITPYMFLLGPLDMDGFKELRQWQIASDALSAVAWLTGTQSIAGTNLNGIASQMLWSTSSVDSYFFTHATSSNAEKLVLRRAGDYLVSVTLPLQRSDANARWTRVGIDVRVNGLSVPQGLGRSGLVENTGAHSESSSHANFLLTGVSPNDYVEVFVEGLTTPQAADVVTVTNQAALYVEYIAPTSQAFAATTTQTSTSTNLNLASSSPLVWTETRQDAGFVHSNTINPQNITLSNPGSYFVQISVPVSAVSGVTYSSVLGRVLLNGAQIPGGIFAQGFMAGETISSDGDASLQFSGVVVSTTSNAVLSITTEAEATLGTTTVTSGFVGSIFIQPVPASDTIVLRGRDLSGGTNWNPAATQTVLWDTRSNYDAVTYTHSTTTNSNQITINTAGDYLLTFNDAITSATARANHRIAVTVGGVAVPGAQTKSHYIRTTGGHNNSSAALTYLLTGVTAGQIVTVTTIQEATAATSNDTTDAILMITKKADANREPAAPSTFNQPFDNIRFASTSPYFDFQGNDPDGNSDIVYQFEISTSSDFSSSQLFSSASTSHFINTSTATDTSPFFENQKVRFQLPASSTLSDLTTYYWRVRAADVAGSTNFGDWTTTQSLTVDLSNAIANWYQTFGPQFTTNNLVGVVRSGLDSVVVDSTVNSEVIMAYGEGTVTTPRYRLWDGSSWGIEKNAVAVGGTINWVKTAAAVSRNEYAMITLDQGSNAYAQIYSASTTSWGNQTLIAGAVSSVTTRGVAIGYESNSGDVLAVSCATGRNIAYRTWNGSSWSATSTLQLSSTNNCNFMQIASDPASDEMILVVRDTGLQYEALVWNGSSFGNSKVLGSSAAVLREGMAVAYESSGDQAVVVVSNGTNNNILYTTWDGTGWSGNSTQPILNDFIYANLASDPASDKLNLCYIDASSRVNSLRWDGGVWSTYFVLDTAANTATARPTDCVFETTAGRAGTILNVHSDTTDSRYRVFATSTWTPEVTIPGISDSFWLFVERAGDGTIVQANLDDVTDILESSAWNGTSWSTKQTIETSPSSVIAAPYEMFDLSAKRFSYNSGVVKTQAINFSNVPNQPTWGDISFGTTEPFGTDVKVKVKYSASSTCDTYIPDVSLAGNSVGFDVSVSPINLTGLSTTTYNQICLEATITTTGSASASLDDWTLSWVREPKLVQHDYRWYVNGNFITPTDVWPLGIEDLVENGAITSDIAINSGSAIRLRMSVQGSNVTQATGTKAYKLQYAEGFSCKPTLPWRDIGAIGSTTAIWRGYSNVVSSSDWYGSSWIKRVKITVNSALATGTDLTNFPVYVNLSDLPSTFFDVVQNDGDDIRVTTLDGVTELPIELVSINTGSKTGELYFKAPSISTTTNTTFYIYYNNPSVGGYSATDTFGRNNVWTNNFAAVWHMNNVGSTIIDSTGKGSTGTKGPAAAAPTQVASPRGSAQSCDGNDYIEFGDVLDPDNADWTISTWFKQSVVGTAQANILYNKENVYEAAAGGGNHQYAWQPSWAWYGPGGFTTASGTWAYGVTTYNKVQQIMYKDGVNVFSRAQTGAIGNNTEQLQFCARGNLAHNSFFNGQLDEVRMASTSRSAGWIKTEFNNQSNPTGFYSVQAEEQVDDGRLLPSTLLSTSNFTETYEAINPTLLNRNALAVGQSSEWDWSLQNNGATSSTNYCFRMVYQDGSSFNTYENYPRLITNAAPLAPSLSAPFDNEQLASTTPWFEFSANDELDDLVSYEIVIDDNADFSSPTITSDSVGAFSLFTNLTNLSERSQYTSGQTIRFVSNTVLSNGVTYYWRVRAKDDFGSGGSGAWSVPSSFTINTATAITTWFQTMSDQFAGNSLEDAVANVGTNDVGIDGGFAKATTTSTVIDYDGRDTGNAWGALTFTQDVTSGSSRYYIEYRVSGEDFVLIPDSALPGNSSGFTSSPVNISALDTTLYNELKVVAVFTGNSTLPRLQDWRVTWSQTIEVPTTVQPFDNAKVSTTTPNLSFTTTDPQSDDLQYEVQLSSSYAFTSSSTFLSGVNAGFVNQTNGADTSPFNSGNTIRYSIQTPLTNGLTYWWRTRARDPSGGNSWSKYSTPKSFTVDTGTTVSTWHQTVGEQFATNDIIDIETTPTTAKITSAIKEVMIAYGEGTGQSPRYNIWNGSSLSATGTADSVGAQIRWLDTEAAPTRPEYALASQGTDLDVTIQIYNSETEIWGNTKKIQTDIGVVNQRGFDIAYETKSGKLLAVSCDGVDAVYSIWNGTSWSATSSLNLANAYACRTVTMESDPNSNEIIAVFEHTNTGTLDYEAQVWNGSTWGSAVTLGNIGTNGNTGAAVNYEDSGDQAIVVVSNGTAASFIYTTWNGLTWAATSTTQTIGNDFTWGSLKRDVGTDRIALCYIDADNDIGVVEWDGSAWNTFTELELLGNSSAGQPVDCEYETTSGRDGYLMVPYSDDGAAGAGAGGSYQFNDGVAWSGKLDLGNLEDSWRVLTVRAKDGIIHSVFFDDTADRYNYVQWDGTDWLVKASISNPSIIGTPFDGSLAMAAQIYPNFTDGSILSTPINFVDGAGPRWERVTFNDSKPGASTISYRVYYENTPGNFILVPDAALSGNSTGFTVSPINISGLDSTIYKKLKLDAQLSCISGNCPVVNDWSVEWSEGITVSGNTFLYDGITAVSSGTVAVAVNGVLQVGKTASISGGGVATNTQVFSSAGTSTFTVPSGVTQVTVKTWGAGGGGGSGGSVDAGGNGGGAGYVQGVLAVTPGENLLVSVGGGGGAAGAGGSAGAGAGGGGYSSLYRTTTPLFIAGAGAGGGGGSRGNPITFTGVGTACAVTAAGCTPTIPAGVADDVYILVLHSRTNTAHSCTTNCGGWTEFSTQAGDVTGGRVSAWYLRRGGSAPANPTFGGPATESYTGRIWGFRGVSATGNPYDALGTNTTQAAVATYTGSALSSSKANVMSVMVGGSMDNNTWGPGGGSCNTPNGVNASFYSANANGTDNSTFLCYDNNPINTPGTISAPSMTIGANGPTDPGRWFNFLLRPDETALTSGGAGGTGGGLTAAAGTSVGASIGGGGGSQVVGGTANGAAGIGAALAGGIGGDGTGGSTGGSSGILGGGAGGSGVGTSTARASGGGGGAGYFGGGGGSESATTSVSGAGGGGGSSYIVTSATATSTVAGSGTVPGNNGDVNYAGSAGTGGTGGASSTAGSAGTPGRMVITWVSTSTSGSWTIQNVPIVAGDVVTVFIDGATTSSRAVGITKYDGIGNITNMSLIERQVTIGSDDVPTISNYDLGLYDSNDDSDLFQVVTGGNVFSLCGVTGCSDAVLRVQLGATYAPAGNSTVINFKNYGSFTPASSTMRVSGVWDQSGTFTPDTSTVIFTATTSSSTLLTATSSLIFNNVTFGETAGAATWNSAKPLVLSGNLIVNFGTLARGTSSILVSGNVALGLNGTVSGLASTTFAGTGSNTWGDAKATSTNMGMVVIDGAAKTITQSGNVAAESITIGSDDTLNSSGSGFNINVFRNWANNNAFIPQNGTVTFVGTTTGTIARGTSAFNNLSFTGVDGIWAFSTSTLVLNGNLTIATGTVTLPTGTTTIAGSFLNTGGTFLHNNGEVRMTSAVGGKTITTLGTTFLNAFYDLVFTGAGAWSFAGAASTTRDMRIAAGTVTLPTTTLFVGGAYVVTGSGAFLHNNGEVRFGVSAADAITPKNSSFNNVRIIGGSGAWFNALWQSRQQITIKKETIPVTLTDFPVYVNLADLGATFFSQVNASGTDIRVTTSDGLTEIPFEIVMVSTSTSAGELYFKAPTLSSTTDSSFYIYYGNTGASAYASSSTYGSQNVWTNGYVGVWHMNDLTTGTIIDSTASGYVGTKGAATRASTQVTSPRGYAQSCDGTDVTTMGNILNPGASPWTISTWYKPTAVGAVNVNNIYTKENVYEASVGGNLFSIAWMPNWAWTVGTPFPTSINNWYYATEVYDKTKQVMYKGGTSVLTSALTGDMGSNTDELLFCARTSFAAPGSLFTGQIDEMRFSNVARSASWVAAEYNNQSTSTDFYSASAVQPQFRRIFTDATTNILGNYVAEPGGNVKFANGVLAVAGSFDNQALFDANGGTVRFNSPSGIETVAAGSSNFATLEFNNAGAVYTVTQNATATVAINLTNVASFTLASGTTLTTTGNFTNAANGANTTWTGSTLLLANGSSSILNAKAHAGDVYGTLMAASNTVARMWNSSADNYVTSGVASAIYSQDHAAVDGDLNIYGNYIRTTGTEYWSYATDFDGAALGTSSARQVDVRIASSSQIGFVNSSLNIVAIDGASTTIDALSGTYGVTASNTTITAEQFRFAGTDSVGLALLASSTLSVFRDGFFTVEPGRSGITIASTTVSKNPSGQYFRIGFATTSAGAASNVTMVGTSSAFVWFRTGSGNLYGETFDANDANPGSIRFDDSSNTVTISGVVYADNGITPLSSPTCNGTTPNVRVVVDGGAYTASTTCAVGTGAYSFANVGYIGDPKVIVYLDTNGGVNGSVVTKTLTGNVTNMNIYANRVITRHQDIAPLTIADMTAYTNANDTDIKFSVASSALSVLPGTELYIFATTTFAPGGNVTIFANASSTSYDGTLQLGAAATFAATGTETHTLGGRLVLATTSVLTSASSTFVFNATTSGKSITSPNTVTFNQLQFTGIGGGWNITAPLSVLGNMNISTGTVTGTSNITLVNGSLTGDGTLSLGAGTTTINQTNTLGGLRAWTFANLVLGNGSAVGTTTPNTSATTTVAGRLTISNAHVLKANATLWDLAGTGTVLTETGTLVEDTSTFRYSGSGSNVLGTGYYNLDINSGAGTNTYTAVGTGLAVANTLSIGGTALSIFNLTTNDPVVTVGGSVSIKSNGTLIGSDSAALTVASDWNSVGTFTSSNGTVVFTSAATSSIAAGNSSFANLTINGLGAFTMTQNATATSNFLLTNHSNFTVASGTTLAVGGTFTNGLGGSATTWTGSTLRLFGGGTKSLNASTTSDVYNVLSVVAGTNVRMWNSSAATYNALGGIYSQDHAGSDGALNIYGPVAVTSGADFWSYATDFDGTALTASSSRLVTVSFASSSSAIYSGGSLTVVGTSTASTSLQNQGVGFYGVTIGGTATANFNTVTIRNINDSGVVFSGTPTVTDFSRTDHLVQINNGTAITVGGTVIDVNQAKNFTNNIFNFQGGITGATNVTATGTAVSSWRFTNHSGALAGEAYDVDPAGDPGYIVWDNSAALITVSGKVYSDEGVTVSLVCDGVTQNIKLVVAGLTSTSTSCNGASGAYSISNVAFSPADNLTVYIDGNAKKAVTVSTDPVSSISNMNLYENRVIVRHENTNPLSIAKMAVWDSSDDADIQFTATDAATDTLVLPADQKLLIWNGKTFEPNGNVTVSGGGAGAAQDGTLEAQANATFRALGTETHTIGGSLIFGTGAVFTAGQSTLTFTTPGAARTIDVNAASFYNTAFTGSGSWTVTDSTFTAQKSVTQSSGAVTYGAGTSTIGASFNITGGTFTMPSAALVFTSTSTGNTVRFNNQLVPAIRFAGTGGAWAMTDTNATTTGSFTVASGTVTLPTGNLGVTRNFENLGGTIVHNTADIIMFATSSSKLLASSSNLFAVRFIGTGPFTMSDVNLTLQDSLVVASGTNLTLATGTLAVAGDFINAGGINNASGTVLFNATTVGKTVSLGTSSLYDVVFGSATGGWTFTGDATTTNNFSITGASSFTKSPNTTLTVGGVFTNLVGGANTTWATSTLRLTGSSSYTINTKVAGGDVYGTLTVVAGTAMRMWNSSAATTTLAASASLYSQDHGGTDGLLNIYGNFTIATSTEYWSYATDFDGTPLASSSRAVAVKIAQNATTTVTTGSLQIVGALGATTTVTQQSTGTYALLVSGGTFNAAYYSLSNLNSTGLTFSGTPVITDLSNGYFNLAVASGTLLTINDTALNTNASKVFTNVGFNATALAGYNVQLVGSTSNAWRFSGSYGNLTGEAFDIDGLTACGSIRWDNSGCLLTQQTQVRWRNDDGGEGAPNNEWVDASFDYRKRVRIVNTDGSAYASTAVKVMVSYDSDMQSNFNDLRFTDTDGVTPVPYWIERYTASTDATVWVRVPVVPANSIATVFMYYGSTTAGTSSNGPATFTFFDDFEDNNITEYSGDTSLFQTDTTPVYGGSYALEAQNKSGRTTSGIYRFDKTVSQGQVLRWMQYVNTAGDEACTLFGVQSPGTTKNNYGVCLERFGTNRISLVKNASDNDVSGTVLASTTVTYSTGWYEVEVDWQTNNNIKAYLRNSAGSLVASTSATDATYSSGGIGYTFWFQNGSWDSYTARPRAMLAPTVYFGAEQTDGGATWVTTQNGVGNGLPGTIKRLRIGIENSGLDITGQTYRLQYASKGVSPTCEAVSNGSYSPVPDQASCGSSPVCMQTSSNVVDDTPTTDLLASTTGNFTPGRLVENPSTLASTLAINQNYYTELEYVLTPTVNASTTLCFRVVNGSTPLDFYSKVAELGLQFDPVFGAANFNNGQPITLTPGATTTIYATSSVTDFNGFSDLVSGSSTIYRSGVGPSCAANNNNCYKANTTASSSCTFANCSGNTCELRCRADIYFHADPTDITPYEGEEWLAYLEVNDQSGGYDFASAPGIELYSLRALSVDSAINYGTLEVNSNTESYNATTTVANYGNMSFDIEITGTDLTDGGSSKIPANQQKFATSTFNYSACVTCSSVSTSTPYDLAIGLAKPTVAAPYLTAPVYWGIAVPLGINSAAHSGINVFTPVSIP